MSEFDYDIIVVGGGHAGSEAGLAAARLGARTALVTFSLKSIGQMSCNPAIGGLGKSQLVKEIDALGGEMALAIDETGIQFRTLNASKGPAVRSTRAQADRDLYKARIARAVAERENLTTIEAAAGGLIFDGKKVSGIVTEDGVKIRSKAVILTTGTFLGGLMHTGEKKAKGGRVGDIASYKLSDSIASLGLKMGRMKTGTPARIKRSSIDYRELIEQPGEEPIPTFSFQTKHLEREQISCWISSTNEQTHEIIQSALHRSPLFNGQIDSTGPRYCPSIEDKVFRFADKDSHNIFLEPEGFQSDIVYPNGISTSLPEDVQDQFIRSIKGLKDCEILVYGYAVEYDYVQPTELAQTLQTKEIEGLYMAGQINGTSGYEEAGAQGIIAGINAALGLQGREPFTVGRDEGYIGVMIDDLTLKGVLEPYRMFTSRAEHRLKLREDNADTRLTPKARELGMITDEVWLAFEERQDRLEKEKGRFQTTIVKPVPESNQWLKDIGSAEISDGTSLAALIRRPELNYKLLEEKYPTEESLSLKEAGRVEIELKFAGYLKRQEEEIARIKKMEDVEIPKDFPYSEISGLRTELVHRLSELRPKTLGQAGRIYGVTPSAISLLAIHLKRKSQARKEKACQ